MKTNWTAADMPSQAGRSFVITGTGGLGYECGLALARAGGDVILAGRNATKGQQAVNSIRAAVAGSTISFELLDLASLASITAFGQRMRRTRSNLDVLINNAGVMVPPRRQMTEDGFELQIGTNYLGHFALTAHLMPLLARGDEARVVNLSSIAARQGTIDFSNLNAERSYTPMPIYTQSKLACLMFAYELQRRSNAANWGITSIAAHPGVSRTDLLHNAPGRFSFNRFARSFLWFLFQPAAQGALPTLYAATAPDAQPGGYYGPHRLSETRGYPAVAKPIPQAADEQVARRLWDVSEDMTNVRFGEVL
ncbi:SDR family NAD(P)-dependent oxidoreductase [Georhizobium profundi]|uniref:SDR family NAD(P)-dependent oxidoreductase n=1 Tax=Georhizobium profundi TaxID=2341112 RepID=A0A3Q8XN79_9HYPH|nr:SDR family oxidoreductase [Georhizobium profundi]AZN71209.1 SDR family NAD(P)-dependent oxidoreductase [Georhizobium profundi]